MTSLLLSDIHLPPGPSPLRLQFLRFLRGPARQARQIFILGDIFEAWIGDDVGIRLYANEVAALQGLQDRGIGVYVQRGNRDFLLGERFEHASGAQLLPDPAVIDIDGISVCISHGDLFCIDDHGYQRWRRFSRNPLAQRVFLTLPSERREALAQRIRSRSRDQTQQKSTRIMDVNLGTVDDFLVRMKGDWLIHGHTHRPAHHQRHLRGRQLHRVVLPDWRPDYCGWIAAEANAAGELSLHQQHF